MNRTVLVGITLTLTLLASACGGVSRQVIVDPRENPAELIGAIDEAARAGGYETRTRDLRSVRFYLDRESGTQLRFQVARRGLVLRIGVRGGEQVPLDVQEAEFARADAIGAEILAHAQQIFEVAERQAYNDALVAETDAERQRLEEERLAQAQAEQAPQNNAAFSAFMGAHNSRRQERRAARSNFGADSSSAGRTSGGSHSSTDSGLSCCINHRSYSCPSASAVDQCVGRFTRCISGCGMECIERCLQSDPPDPSSCTPVDGGC